MKESIEIKEKLSEDSKGSCRRIRDRKPERRRVIKEPRCKNKGKNLLRAEKRRGLCMGFAAGLTAAALLGKENTGGQGAGKGNAACDWRYVGQR